jgi:DNA-directed RNA polymerase subunit RPC12/RpoP
MSKGVVMVSVKFFKNTLLGTIGGIGLGGALIVLGILLSLTGLGAIIGIPVAFIGFVMALSGPFSGFFVLEGPCPYCGTQITTSKTKQGVTCGGCKQRVLIRDKQLVKIPQ